MPRTINDLRRFAVARSLFPPTTLKRAIEKLGFVQADPIRAPARAQDLTLRHRVKGYRAGDLERRYAALDVEEDFFVNYGFLPRAVQALMHPRVRARPCRRAGEEGAGRARVRARARRGASARGRRAFLARFGDELLGRLVVGHHAPARQDALPRRAARGAASRRHPDLRGACARARADRRGRTSRTASTRSSTSSCASTRRCRREPGLARQPPALRRAAVDGRAEARAGARARARLAHARVDGVDWYWPAGERLPRGAPDDAVRFLAPFDPVVWDRRRFELLWGWAYRFEAYTPAPRRRLGYYALPLLWRDQVIGWGNLSVADGALRSDVGFVARRPRERAFTRELAARAPGAA